MIDLSKQELKFFNDTLMIPHNSYRMRLYSSAQKFFNFDYTQNTPKITSQLEVVKLYKNENYYGFS